MTYQKGYWVPYEYKIGEGKSVDLVAEKDERRIAVEIETGKSDAIYNIRKDLAAEFEKAICICLKDKLKIYFICRLKEGKIDKKESIEVLNLKEFLNSNHKD